MEKVKRKFLEDRLKVRQWEDIRPIYQWLLNRRLVALSSLRTWLADWNELEGAIQEEEGWRYIHMTRDTTKEITRKVYEHYIKEIEPHLGPIRRKLQVKALEYPITELLRKQEKAFDIFFRCVENNIRCFREENVLIQTQIQYNVKEYRDISSKMTIDLHGGEMTLQNATAHLESIDQSHRKEVYDKIVARRLQEKDTFNDLYTVIIRHRHQIAVNANFDNFRDYSFVSLNRFDYTPQDCFDFHKTIKEEVVPFLNKFAQERKMALGVPVLKPWDHAVDIHGMPPLAPVTNTEDLIKKCRRALK